MIKVKKSLSFVIIAFLILSNLAFAQSISSNETGPRENSNQSDNRKGNFNEQFDNGRGNFNDRHDDSFNPMEGTEMMKMHHGDSGQRGEFSYEQEGFEHRYDAGPSYEGFSKEQMLFSVVFENIGDDIDPREIKDKCNEPNKIADIVIAKLKSKVGGISSLCKNIEARESNCGDYSKKMCGTIGTPKVTENANEMEKMQSIAFACPVNKNAIIQACILRSKTHLDEQMSGAAESCQKRASSNAERMKQECEKLNQNQVCSKDKYISQCLSNIGVRKDDFDDIGKRKVVCPKYPTPNCGEGTKLEIQKDANGCENYRCVSASQCPTVTRPSCATGETLQTYYDNARCISGYQCIKAQPKCIEPTKPTCSSGQTMTTKYDSNNCPSYECVTVKTTSSSPTGAAVLSTYDDYAKQCESNWERQEKVCSSMKSNCDQNNFVDRCKEMMQKNSEGMQSKIEESCTTQTQSFMLAAEDKCSRIDKEKQKCFEQTEKRCSQMQGLSAKCKETLTEENIRKFIVREAGKRCKFSDKLENKEGIRKTDKAEIVLAVVNTATQSDFDKLNLFVNDLKEDLKLQDTTVYKGAINPNNFGDIKLLPFVVNAKISTEVKEKIVASQKAEDTASKLASLRDSDVPKQYLYIIEDKANDVLNVSDNLNQIEKKDEEKGIGYKMKRFLGLAKQAEQDEIKQLQESKSKLQNSIDTLTKLVDEVPSDVAKAILKEQVENLKKQQADIQILIDSKEKKAKGFFGLFG